MSSYGSTRAECWPSSESDPSAQYSPNLRGWAGFLIVPLAAVGALAATRLIETRDRGTS
jgi:hypothetical protein